MKIQNFHLHLRRLDEHKCPRCGEQLERRPRRLWQKAVSFALPLRHYRCDGCNRRFFAFSPRWNRMHIAEKFVRSLATVAVLLIVLFASLILLWEIMIRLMA
ncbi:MAG: hypothetical protein OP8BY_2373 [Candidatus Saccharicenans subterraneus]|uniref:C2H2-type domain-containing protein n=1 Tax=Candidatus Saccharicenans subterraneus TaxID=2508984 RepID=A0A3E2BJL1_9BACT|nr:MAG: hypothetical protein OP8BY_2373 [Candidatus Saccharicenans subterraneum]